jgi:hypothetical protein
MQEEVLFKLSMFFFAVVQLAITNYIIYRWVSLAFLTPLEPQTHEHRHHLPFSGAAVPPLLVRNELLRQSR